MKIRSLLICIILFVTGNTLFGQQTPQINIKYSKLLATYDFVQKLSDYYPDNKSKEIFKASKYNIPKYTDLLIQLDTLRIVESYHFQGYPSGQKSPVSTTALMERNLINASSIEEFKSLSFGIVPNTELFAFSAILEQFEPVYESLIYLPNNEKFENKLMSLDDYVQSVHLTDYFETGLKFYNAQWDYAVSIDISIIPSISDGGFAANAFLNNAVSEVPLNFVDNDILFCVLMHEIFHNVYDWQSLEVKNNIESWFHSNPSPNSQYAYLLLNEALATSMGNGYIYEGLNGKSDKDSWYNNKYINQMAQAIYPMVKAYANNKKPIDKHFIDQYIKTYDENFSDWAKELDHILTYRYILTDNENDFSYFRKHFRYANHSAYGTPIDQNSLDKMKQRPITKIVIVSQNNEEKLNWIKNTFPELKNWTYNAKKEFIDTIDLADKTKLIIVNSINSTFQDLFEKRFENKQMN